MCYNKPCVRVYVPSAIESRLVPNIMHIKQPYNSWYILDTMRNNIFWVSFFDKSDSNTLYVYKNTWGRLGLDASLLASLLALLLAAANIIILRATFITWTPA